MSSQHEQLTKQAAHKRAWGYAFLWIFLGSFIFSLSRLTELNYPMDTTISLCLIAIGVIKLVRAWKGIVQ